MSEPCQYCGTPMKSGAPVDDYCPNQECTGHRDAFLADLREHFRQMKIDNLKRDASLALYEACNDAFDFLGGVDGAAEVRGKLLTAIMMADGRAATRPSGENHD